MTVWAEHPTSQDKSRKREKLTTASNRQRWAVDSDGEVCVAADVQGGLLDHNGGVLVHQGQVPAGWVKHRRQVVAAGGQH